MKQQMSPELRELKKQTRIQAERSALFSWIGGALIGVIISLVLALNMVPLPWWAFLAIPVGLGVAAYYAELHRLTRD